MDALFCRPAVLPTPSSVAPCRHQPKAKPKPKAKATAQPRKRKLAKDSALKLAAPPAAAAMALSAALVKKMKVEELKTALRGRGACHVHAPHALLHLRHCRGHPAFA